MNEEMDALLAARQYEGAAKFAQEMIGRDPANQPLVGSKLTNTAEKLNQANDARSALALIAEATKIRPPLDPRVPAAARRSPGRRRATPPTPPPAGAEIKADSPRRRGGRGEERSG